MARGYKVVRLTGEFRTAVVSWRSSPMSPLGRFARSWPVLTPRSLVSAWSLRMLGLRLVPEVIGLARMIGASIATYMAGLLREMLGDYQTAFMSAAFFGLLAGVFAAGIRLPEHRAEVATVR